MGGDGRWRRCGRVLLMPVLAVGHDDRANGRSGGEPRRHRRNGRRRRPAGRRGGRVLAGERHRKRGRADHDGCGGTNCEPAQRPCRLAQLVRDADPGWAWACDRPGSGAGDRVSRGSIDGRRGCSSYRALGSLRRSYCSRRYCGGGSGGRRQATASCRQVGRGRVAEEQRRDHSSQRQAHVRQFGVDRAAVVALPEVLGDQSALAAAARVPEEGTEARSHRCALGLAFAVQVQAGLPEPVLGVPAQRRDAVLAETENGADLSRAACLDLGMPERRDPAGRQRRERLRQQRRIRAGGQEQLARVTPILAGGGLRTVLVDPAAVHRSEQVRAERVGRAAAALGHCENARERCCQKIIGLRRRGRKLCGQQLGRLPMPLCQHLKCGSVAGAHSVEELGIVCGMHGLCFARH